MNKKPRSLVVAAIVLGVAAGGNTYAQSCQTGTPVAQCVFQGLLNTRLGNAVLSLDNEGGLVVGSIGSTGQDGVRITPVNPARTAHEDWEELARWIIKQICPSQICTTGASFEATGTLITGESIVVAQTVTTGAPGPQEIAISPNFTPIGASTFRIRIFNGAVPPAVVDLPGQNQAVTVDEFPTGFAFTDRDYGVTWDTPRSITIPGAGTFVGDELRLEPESPAVPMGRLSQVELRAADVTSAARGAGSFTILQEFLFRSSSIPALGGGGILALVLSLLASGAYLARRWMTNSTRA